jgi:Uma2 family endonuclease
MVGPAQKLFFTFAEYLEREQASETKHEYLNGQIYDMAGGTVPHGRIAANVIGVLFGQLRGRPCSPQTSDVRVRVQATGLTTYPDVSVVCGEAKTDVEDPNAIVNPVVLVEVLSPSSEAYDRGEKFAHYRRIPSLQEYVLVSYQTRRIEVYRRGEGGVWSLHEARDHETMELVSIGCTLALDDVYRNVEPSEPAPVT